MIEPTQIIGASILSTAWLAMRSGNQLGRDHRLGVQTTVGRDAMTCDLVLDDESVSAEHARIRREGGQFVLYDLASTNGTYLNGRRIQRAALDDGDTIRFGVTEMIFKEVRDLGN